MLASANHGEDLLEIPDTPRPVIELTTAAGSVARPAWVALSRVVEGAIMLMANTSWGLFESCERGGSATRSPGP